MPKIRPLLLSLAILAIGVLPARAAPAPVKVIRIAGATLYAGGKSQLIGLDAVIEQQGWLRAELARRGVSLEWYPTANAAVGPLINEGFASHTIQFASYGDLPAIILNGNGGVPRTQLLAPAAPSDAFLVVPSDSPVRGINDLKGKKLAIHKGRPWEIPLLRLLDSKGLRYSDFQIYNINPDAGASAVATGAIDGLFTISAYGLQEKHVAKIIWSTKQAPADWKMGMGFWGARDFIEQHPDLTQVVVTAYVRAAQWASQDANRDAVVKLGTLNGTPEKVVRLTYDDPSLPWKDRWSPRFTPLTREHYRQTISYAVNKKIVRQSVNANALLNERFVEAAVKSLGFQDYWSAPAAPAPAKASAQPPARTTAPAPSPKTAAVSH